MTKLHSDVNSDGSIDIATGFDGSWKDRGWKSTNGFTAATAEETSQVVDVHHMINSCRQCSRFEWELENGLIGQLEYLKKVVNHDKSGKCRYNHVGSAQTMESTGTVEIYKRSKEEGIVRYNPFVGDGDSSSFTRVRQLQPYGPNVAIEKDECHVHVVRRMGRALIFRRRKNLLTVNVHRELGP